MSEAYFTTTKVIGEHTILNYNISKYRFLEQLQTIFQIEDLSQIHTISKDYTEFTKGNIANLQDIEADLHKRFYTAIKSDNIFKKSYCDLIKDILNHLYPNESMLIYQSFPSIRFQFIGNKAIPAHCDSDSIGKHPLGEKNFLIPITDMKNTTQLFIESAPEKGDFQGINLKYGNLFYFNGNRCIHYNQTNQENYTRISFDFRVICLNDYMKYILQDTITTTNPRDPQGERKPVKMVIGGYYQSMFKDDSIEEILNWHFQKEKIIQTRPSFNELEAKACYDYMTTGDPFLTEFKKTTELEESIKNFIGAKHCFMTTSGTSALILAYLAINIMPGDEIIVPNYTMVATANSVKLLGAVPVLADVDSTTFTITLDEIKRKITSKTKAIVHVSLNNREKELREIVEYCKEKSIYLIEDAAQSLGCFNNGKHFGTFGDIGCFSLSTPKIISTGQGGFVVTDNDELASRLWKIKNFGRKAGGLEEYDIFGLNFKFTDIQAVIGIEQFKKLPERIKRMKEIYSLYSQHIPMLLPSMGNEWIPWFIDLKITNRDKLMHFLNQHNIQTRITYPALHALPMYNGNDCDFVNSLDISTNGVFLPSHILLTNSEINFIGRCVRCFNKYTL
jgi:perosamine synthetase